MSGSLVQPSNRTQRFLAVLLLTLGVAVDSAGASASPPPVRVRASVAFAPCLGPVLAAFTRETGTETALQVAEPDPPGDADLVVGDDSETTRLLESGRADLGSALDLGYLRWVVVAPPGASADVRAAASASESGITVLGGAAGREARTSLKGLASQIRTTVSETALRQARMALLPSSLAGSGEHRPSAVRPLVATAAVVRGAAGETAARRLLAFLGGPTAKAILSRSLLPSVGADAPAGTGGVFVSAIVDYWVPACSLAGNYYNDPQELLGPPDALYLGVKDDYLGMMSLGQGGWVVVEMAQPVVDGPGPDVRVYQTAGNEPVTLYASNQPTGPWTLIALRVPCGDRSPRPTFSHHCDFDLQGSGLPSARYFKVEDGEIYPCLAAGTHTEGADIDAVEALNH